jgi:hypothetical protein
MHTEVREADVAFCVLLVDCRKKRDLTGNAADLTSRVFGGSNARIVNMVDGISSPGSMIACRPAT